MNKFELIKRYQDLFGTEKSILEIMKETHNFLSTYKDKSVTISELLVDGAFEELRLIVEEFKKYNILDELLLNSGTNSLALFGDFSSLNYRDMVVYLSSFEKYIELINKELNPTIKDKVFQKPPYLFYLKKASSANSESVLIKKTIESVKDIFSIQKQDSNYTLYKIEKDYTYIGINHQGYEFVFRGDFESDISEPSAKVMTLLLKMWVEENCAMITAQNKEYKSFESHFNLQQTDIKLESPWHSNAGCFFKNDVKEQFDFSAYFVKIVSEKCFRKHDLKLLKGLTGDEKNIEPALNEHFKCYYDNITAEKNNARQFIQVKEWRNLMFNQKSINDFVSANWFKDVMKKGSFHNHNKLQTTPINYNMVGTDEELEYYKKHLQYELRSDLKMDLFMLLKTIKNIEFMIYGDNPVNLPSDAFNEIPRMLDLIGNIKNLTTPGLFDKGWSVFYVKGNDNINKVLKKWELNPTDLHEAVLALPTKKTKASPYENDLFKDVSSGFAENLLIVQPDKKLITEKTIKDYSMKIDTRIDLCEKGSVARVTEVKQHANSRYNLFVEHVKQLNLIDIDLPKQVRLGGTLKIDLDVLDMTYYCLFGEHFMTIEDTFFIFPRDIERYVFEGHRGLFDKEWSTASVQPMTFTRILTKYVFIDGKLIPFYPENNDVIMNYLENPRKRPEAFYDMGVSAFMQINIDDVKLLKSNKHGTYKYDKLHDIHSSQESERMESQRFLSSTEIKETTDTEVVFTLKYKKYREGIPESDKQNAGMLGTIISTGKKIKILTEFGDELEFTVGGIKNTGWVHLSTVNPQVDILNHFTTAEKILKREKGFKLFIKYNQELIGNDDLLKIE